MGHDDGDAAKTTVSPVRTIVSMTKGDGGDEVDDYAGSVTGTSSSSWKVAEACKARPRRKTQVSMKKPESLQ